MNWSQLTTQGRIDAIRSVWRPGMSAAQIAAHFDGVSRNAVIGIFHRHAKKIGASMYLGVKGENGQEKPKRKGKSANNLVWRMKQKPKLRVVKPEPAIERAVFGAPHVAGIRLADFNSHRCKWCINDPEQGANEHLFCGETTNDGPYCAYHSTLAYRPVGRVDERGTEQQAA